MATYSDQEITSINEALAKDPTYQKLVAARRASGNSSTRASQLGGVNEQRALQSYLASLGITLSGSGLTTDMDGQVVHDHHVRDSILASGALLGGGIAAGAAGGAAAAAPTAGSGVGVGETGAVTGLGGSGMGGAAAAGTGILDKVTRGIGATAPILGNMAQSGAQANQLRDVAFVGAENAKLARDKYALDAPTTRLNQSVRSSILRTAQPTHVNWGGPGSGLRGEVPTFSGGYANALETLDPQAKEMAGSVLSKNLQDQLAGKDDETTYLDKVGKTSTADKIVGGAATGTSILEALRRSGVI